MIKKFSQEDLNKILLSKQLNELYLAVIENRQELLTDEEYEEILKNRKTNGKVEELFDKIKTNQNLKKYSQELTKVILSLSQVRHVAILTLIDDEVYDVGGAKFVDLKRNKIINYDNFTKYYNKTNARVRIFTPREEPQIKENTALIDVDDLSNYQSYENMHIHQEQSDDLTSQFLGEIKGKTYTLIKQQ